MDYFNNSVKLIETAEHKTYITDGRLIDAEIIDLGYVLSPDEDSYEDFRLEPQGGTSTPVKFSTINKLEEEIVDCETFSPCHKHNKVTDKYLANNKLADKNKESKNNKDKNDSEESIVIVDEPIAPVGKYALKNLRKHEKEIQEAIQQRNDLKAIDIKKNQGLIGIKVKHAENKHNTHKKNSRSKGKCQEKQSNGNKQVKKDNQIRNSSQILIKEKKQDEKYKELKIDMTERNINNVRSKSTDNQKSLLRQLSAESTKLEKISKSLLSYESSGVKKNIGISPKSSKMLKDLPSLNDNLDPYKKIPDKSVLQRNKESSLVISPRTNIKNVNDIKKQFDSPKTMSKISIDRYMKEKEDNNANQTIKATSEPNTMKSHKNIKEQRKIRSVHQLTKCRDKLNKSSSTLNKFTENAYKEMHIGRKTNIGNYMEEHQPVKSDKVMPLDTKNNKCQNEVIPKIASKSIALESDKMQKTNSSITSPKNIQPNIEINGSSKVTNKVESRHLLSSPQKPNLDTGAQPDLPTQTQVAQNLHLRAPMPQNVSPQATAQVLRPQEPGPQVLFRNALRSQDLRQHAPASQSLRPHKAGLQALRPQASDPQSLYLQAPKSQILRSLTPTPEVLRQITPAPQILHPKPSEPQPVQLLAAKSYPTLNIEGTPDNKNAVYYDRKHKRYYTHKSKKKQTSTDAPTVSVSISSTTDSVKSVKITHLPLKVPQHTLAIGLKNKDKKRVKIVSVQHFGNVQNYMPSQPFPVALHKVSKHKSNAEVQEQFPILPLVTERRKIVPKQNNVTVRHYQVPAAQAANMQTQQTVVSGPNNLPVQYETYQNIVPSFTHNFPNNTQPDTGMYQPLINYVPYQYYPHQMQGYVNVNSGGYNGQNEITGCPYIVPMYRPPPPPPAPRPSLNATQQLKDNESVIGKNDKGLIKKINISTPHQQSPISETKENTIKIESDIEPVSTKSEMLKELDSSIIKIEEENPVTPTRINLKRSFNSDDNDKKTDTYKPCPLSKKMKANDPRRTPEQNRDKIITSKGYSPPILPIPTYQNFLSDYKPIVPKTRKSCNENKEKVSNPSRIRFSEAELYKISLSEYKNRTSSLRRSKHCK